MYPHKEYLKPSLCFGSQNLFFQPIKCLYMTSVIMLPLVRHGSSAIPFADGKFEYIKLKINTELLFALSSLQDMLCHARIPHQLPFGTLTTHISATLFLPHGCQLAISPFVAFWKLKAWPSCSVQFLPKYLKLPFMSVSIGVFWVCFLIIIILEGVALALFFLFFLNNPVLAFSFARFKLYRHRWSTHICKIKHMKQPTCIKHMHNCLQNHGFSVHITNPGRTCPWLLLGSHTGWHIRSIRHSFLAF